MRFTKIPLIATLMAVALSLLIVLPGLAQENQKTDGQLKNVDITVGVFENVRDAQLGKLTNTAIEAGLPSGTTIEPNVYVPKTTAITRDHGTAESTHTASGDPAYLMTPQVSPQDTFFKNTLYVSNQVGAFNTVLINVANDATETCVPDDTTTTPLDESTLGMPRVSATVKNNRSNQTIKVQLALSSAAGNFQAFFKVVESGATGTFDPDGTPDNGDEVQVAYGTNTSEVYAGPTWCDDERRTGSSHTDDDSNPATPSNNDDGDPATTDTPAAFQLEAAATAAVYGPVRYAQNAAPAGTQEIATIFARHGDRLTITTDGGSGQVQLLVDGEGPDISAVTPDDNTVTRPGRLTYSFEVRDDDSGLRHDGEPITSPDGDLQEINPDQDPNLADEPLSERPGTQVSTNGAAQDIDVNVVDNNMNDEDLNDGVASDWEDISASGSWRMTGSRAGVAYSFTASGAHLADDNYLYQVIAKDRAGNETVTDADDRASGDQPYVFRVDDADPELGFAQTGISYDTDGNKEVVDRSYIMLDFGSDALGDVDTDNITVVGSDIVGMIHPSVRPHINRGETPATQPTGSAPDEPTAPAVVAMPAASLTRATTDTTGRIGDLTLAATCSETTAPTAETPGPAITVSTSITDATAQETSYCASWESYRMYLVAQNTYNTAKMAYDNYNQYSRENPGKDITGAFISDPRSRVYLELSEPLASDAEPAVVVVGGAVFDLAGNTNPAKTLSKAQDWIAPRLTVSVTGTENDRPVANSKGSFTVDVRSDEDVARRPVVFFVTATAKLNSDSDGYDYNIAEIDTASPLTQQEDDNHWSRKYKSTAIGDGAFDGLVGVVVLARDENDNSGASAGWTPGAHQNAANPTMGNKLVLSKMDGAGLLIEIDDDLADAAGKFVTPRSDAQGSEGGKVTESANPFVKLEFTDEGKEYNSCDMTNPDTLVCGRPAGDGLSATPKAEFGDSHGNVNVTEITLNGDDVMANLARVDKNQFSLVLRDLEDRSYTVAYTAKDDAGNEVEGTFKFTKEPREPYEIGVTPGWNLISLPATPLDPAIGSVLAGNPYISPVLGYQDGDWLTAIQEEEGTWRGRLTEITGGFGYWVHARTFETIETMLSETDPAATLPTVPVTAGWNLLGVLDIHQNAAGDPPGVAGENGDEANNYFGSIPWRVAYAYNTTASLWVKTVPGETATMTVTTNGVDEEVEVQEILNGKGYWVWSSSPSTLAP